MDSDSVGTVFTEARVRRAFWGQLAAQLLLWPAAAAAGGLLAWLLHPYLPAWLAGLAGGVLALALGLHATDYVNSGWFNRGCRQALLEKLQRVGELTFGANDPEVYFIGLAHADRVGWSRLETDDDLGFLRLGHQGLEYRGDRLTFVAPYETIEELRLEPLGYGYPPQIKRLALRFTDDDPLPRILLCGREGDRVSTGNRATHTLFEALTQRRNRAPKPHCERLLGGRETSREQRYNDELSEQI